jgi:hypothetical protein
MVAKRLQREATSSGKNSGGAAARVGVLAVELFGLQGQPLEGVSRESGAWLRR